jgi:hypothetical protein
MEGVRYVQRECFGFRARAGRPPGSLCGPGNRPRPVASRGVREETGGRIHGDRQSEDRGIALHAGVMAPCGSVPRPMPSVVVPVKAPAGTSTRMLSVATTPPAGPTAAVTSRPRAAKAAVTPSCEARLAERTTTECVPAGRSGGACTLIRYSPGRAE